MKGWHGIKGIRFIYHGDYSDAEIEYKGHVLNEHDVEDALYSRYLEDCREEGRKDTFEGFSEFMRNNERLVKEYIEDAIEYREQHAEMHSGRDFSGEKMNDRP